MFQFQRYANHEDGVWLSELLPHTATIADEMCLVRSMHTEAINHEPAITFFQTGSQVVGRPSFGAWMSYGLGSANANLPTFVVMITQGLGNMQALSERFWGSGFLPKEHQGCKLRSGDDPGTFTSKWMAKPASGCSVMTSTSAVSCSQPSESKSDVGVSLKRTAIWLSRRGMRLPVRR